MSNLQKTTAFVAALALAAKVSAVDCTTAERVANSCSWALACTSDEAVPTPAITCATTAAACTDNAGCASGYCDVGVTDVCALCTTAGATCENSGQCPTTGDMTGKCSAANTCTTTYATTDECSVGSYCYNNTTSATFTCVPACTDDASCSDTPATYNADNVCQTMSSICTPAC